MLPCSPRMQDAVFVVARQNSMGFTGICSFATTSQFNIALVTALMGEGSACLPHMRRNIVFGGNVLSGTWGLPDVVDSLWDACRGHHAHGADQSHLGVRAQHLPPRGEWCAAACTSNPHKPPNGSETPQQLLWGHHVRDVCSLSNLMGCCCVILSSPGPSAASLTC